jgi:hypothetical protein
VGTQNCNAHKERCSEVKKRRSLAIDYKRSALRETTRCRVKNKLPRGQPDQDLQIPSKLVIEFAMQEILLTLKWLDKFLENLLFARPLYLFLSILKPMT